MARRNRDTSRATTPRGPRGSNVASIYETLRGEIISMQLRPGEILDETSLAERFDVSRSPIRESIIRLAGEGLVTVLPNRSTIVSTLDLQSVPQYLDALELIQRAVTRLAAANRNAGHLVKIRRFEKEFADSLDPHDISKMLAANYDYHMAIAEAADNKYFTLLYGRLLDEGKRLLRMNFSYEADVSNGADSILVREHAEITAAIEAGNRDEAERLGHEHAVGFRKRILRHFQNSEMQNVSV